MNCIWSGEQLLWENGRPSDLSEECLLTLQRASNYEYLDTLAGLATNPTWTEAIFTTFEPLFVDFVNRWRAKPFSNFNALDQVFALAKILPHAPHLSLYAEDIAVRQKADELAVLSSNAASLVELSEDRLTQLLLTVLRLLDFDDHVYMGLVSPSKLQELLKHPALHVRYLAVRILCVCLRIAEATLYRMVTTHVGDGAVLGPWEGKIIDYRFLILWEEKRIRDLKAALDLSRDGRDVSTEAAQPRILSQANLSSSTAQFAGILVPSLSNRFEAPSFLIPTPTTKLNLQKVADAFCKQRPLLITGLPGSGKSSIVHGLARGLCQSSNMVTLHLNEQTDAKLLIGLYTAGETLGSFKWQPGVLTTAVLEGRWVLIEDLDRVPDEVISLLLPLLDRGELLVPNLGGIIRPAQSFRIIGTIRSKLNAKLEETTPGLAMLGYRHWTKVQLDMLSHDDIKQIFRTRHPILKSYENEIVAVSNAMKTSRDLKSGDARSHFQSSRLVGPREVLRYCSRLDSLLSASGVHSKVSAIPEALRDSMFLEAVDCFTSAISDNSVKAQMIESLASVMSIPLERANFCLHSRIPSYSDNKERLNIGRTSLSKPRDQSFIRSSRLKRERRPLAITNHALRYMESISSCVKMEEPCLLVGETGTGKTTMIQEMANSLGHNLVVVNLSRQSEASDLLGGFKPMNMRAFALPIKEEFDVLFEDTFSSAKNQAFLKSINRALKKEEWKRLLSLMQEAQKMVASTLSKKTGPQEGNPKKRRKLENSKYQGLQPKWDNLDSRLGVFESHLNSGSKGFAFSYVEGNIVKAVRNGDWVLLDEINLASADTLECIADLLSHESGEVPSLLLTETGNAQRIHAHPNFRIFGAMNPATDAGKRDLPSSLRSRFTEHFVQPPDQDPESLIQIIKACLGNHSNHDTRVSQDVSSLYLEIRKLEKENRLIDGSGQRPHFSLRTLTRSLTYAVDMASSFGLRQALHEGFSMCFLTLLDRESVAIVQSLIEKHVFGHQKNARALLKQSPAPRYSPGGSKHVKFGHYWMPRGPFPVKERPKYIITPFVEANLLNLVRATSTRRYPVLLQGPTSSGKTSMVEYLANISGNKFVRINNHEHTDLQEYLGNYVSGPDGLQFQEGLLVQAIREGHWIVLDELNLAPTDILEALNRLLDDNREIFIPETQETVRPHENFMLFATQNPPGMYGGRKVLSRAFRTRFLELHFDDIPENELETILRERVQIAPSYCKNIVEVYKRLAVLRQSGRLFEQKNSFATLRDLFRWAQRDADDRDELAVNGYMLLGERVRDPEERQVVKGIIEDVMRVKINETSLYSADKLRSINASPDMKDPARNFVWTKGMRRLYVLTAKALKCKEPVLLVGPTGCGKTFLCQVVAEIFGKHLSIVNAHQNTETGDLIGAQRPLRNRPQLEEQLRADIILVLKNTNHEAALSTGRNLSSLISAYKELPPAVIEGQSPQLRDSIELLIVKSKALFEWCDGSLVSAMKEGHHFLLDEISLADDSVLERLNSVLESERTITMAEKGSQEAHIIASEGFQFLATMNPGGDYGKRELSPALRNRFTEIWVPPFTDEEDILQIAQAKLNSSLRRFARPIVEFARWYGSRYSEGKSSVSIREILAWIDFVNLCKFEDPRHALAHGAAMVYLDGLGANPAAKLSIKRDSIDEERIESLNTLSRLFNADMASIYNADIRVLASGTKLIVGVFDMERFATHDNNPPFSFQASTTLSNTMRIARAFQIAKPVLIEGSPGVGKTTLVAALAAMIGVPLARVNLSEQTDIMDLFGSDIPVPDGKPGQFAWSDAPFLQAMQRGEWVLLDEMNLASQSILEGLNACLDHRGKVYVPELDRTFAKHQNFRVFAAQNPHSQGGGRKGLPASFVDRFTIVYADSFTLSDILTISSQLYPSLSADAIEQVTQYMSTLSSQTSANGWEFNLRDILRWLELLCSQQRLLPAAAPTDFQNLVVCDRFRDRKVDQAAQSQIGPSRNGAISRRGLPRKISEQAYQCGNGLLYRDPVACHLRYEGYNGDSGILESVMICVQQNWPCLLVGPSGAGKSRLINHLGSITGTNVVTLSLNSEVDTMDLVGGYEQFDAQRHVSAFLHRLRAAIRVSIARRLSEGADAEIYFRCLEATDPATASDLHAVSNLLRECSLSEGQSQYHDMALECDKLKEFGQHLAAARFEWVEGMLIQALKNGCWLVLDNANLCGSSVLDRLNSLLEPDGSLILNEHRSPDAHAQVVRPHPDFRVFLTMDPRHGELSRAMRNRCVEIYIHGGQDLPSGRAEPSHSDSRLARFKGFECFDWRALSQVQFSAAVDICFDSLSFRDLGGLASWYEQVCNGLLSIQPHRLKLFHYFHKVCEDLNRQQQGVKSALSVYYESLISQMGLESAVAQSVNSAQVSVARLLASSPWC